MILSGVRVGDDQRVSIKSCFRHTPERSSAVGSIVEDGATYSATGETDLRLNSKRLAGVQ